MNLLLRSTTSGYPSSSYRTVLQVKSLQPNLNSDSNKHSRSDVSWTERVHSCSLADRKSDGGHLFRCMLTAATVHDVDFEPLYRKVVEYAPTSIGHRFLPKLYHASAASSQLCVSVPLFLALFRALFDSLLLKDHNMQPGTDWFNGFR